MHFHQWKRREFITLLGGAWAWPLVARAQQPERVRRIGILMAGADDADGRARVAAFRQGLRELGWQEGRNIIIDSRWAGGGSEQIRAVAAELVGHKPDVILVNGNRGLAALRQESGGIPIVFAGLNDPVENGFVASLARPGGNITGFANFELSMLGKLMGMLKQLAPRLARVAIVMGGASPSQAERYRNFAATDYQLGINA
jgi:putative tryptophan/tyrosine transport system substrate-binding protein